jgi:hypothetical protein
MFKDGQITKKMPLSDFVDNSFAEKAEQKAKREP